MIRLDLASLDVPNLTKPYLMVAANGYCDVNPACKLHYVRGYHSGGFALANGADPRHVVPTRETLGLVNGHAGTLREALLHGLATAPQPIYSVADPARGTLDYTAWARAAQNHWYGMKGGKKEPLYWRFENTPLGAHRRPSAGRVVGRARSNRVDRPELKAVMMTLAEEMPYYPLDRWDIAMPLILPIIQYERSGAAAVASYVRLVQEERFSEAEHFPDSCITCCCHCSWRGAMICGSAARWPSRSARATSK